MRDGHHRSGFTALEILVALALISIAVVPILCCGSSNARSAKADQVRMMCDSLCRSLLERYGTPEDDVWRVLRPTDDPRLREDVDLWTRDRTAASGLDSAELEETARAYDIHSRTTVRRDVRPGLDQLTSSVTWKTKGGGRTRVDSISYSRLLVRLQAL
ncbi:MAG: prepilin-type N-terminal cleavage/methylation domain-containing protein [Candidatus Riflebacteria bacterium]|nr:prepilin-type N-terminal cleavage/methylation domain-containing protein [Candidatus Riflebacteria bacterium]